MRSMLVFMGGGATSIYVSGLAGTHGIHVVGGVPMGYEAMHTEL